MHDTQNKGKRQWGDIARYAKERKTAEGRQCKIRQRKENGRGETMQDTPKKGKRQREDNARYAKERKMAEMLWMF